VVHFIINFLSREKWSFSLVLHVYVCVCVCVYECMYTWPGSLSVIQKVKIEKSGALEYSHMDGNMGVCIKCYSSENIYHGRSTKQLSRKNNRTI
jgi:CO dehydrogenase/acetyl-CoA synthase alpha subunit